MTDAAALAELAEAIFRDTFAAHNTAEDMTAEHAGEIQRLYVDKNYHGQGLAHQLMHACLDVFQQRQTTKVWLGVWEQNPRAISFYKKFNFQEVGEHIFVLGADRQRDIILALALNQFSS